MVNKTSLCNAVDVHWERTVTPRTACAHTGKSLPEMQQRRQRRHLIDGCCANEGFPWLLQWSGLAEMSVELLWLWTYGPTQASDWGSDTCLGSMGGYVFRLLAVWQFPLIAFDEKRKASSSRWLLAWTMNSSGHCFETLKRTPIAIGPWRACGHLNYCTARRGSGTCNSSSNGFDS